MTMTTQHLADLCPDCGRPQTASYREWWENTMSLCGVPTRAEQAEVRCLTLTTERLRARVAELEQQLDASDGEAYKKELAVIAEKPFEAFRLTVYAAQTEQPWSVPYASKHWVNNAEGQLKHALLHACKSIGKLSSIIEHLDHDEKSWLSDAELDSVADYAADLVSAALRIGNVVGRSIAHRLVSRVRDKNGNGYGEPLPENQRARFGAMLCR